MTSYFGNLVYNAHGLIETAPNRRGTGKLIDLDQLAVRLEIVPIEFIDPFLEAKVLIPKSFHHDHGMSTTAVRIRIPLAKNIHDGFWADICLDLETYQEFLRETSPAGKALLADSLDLLIGKRATRLFTIFLNEFFLEDPTVLEKRIPEDDLLNHVIVFTVELINAEDILAEEDVGSHLRLQATHTLTAADMGIHEAFLTCNPILDLPIADTPLVMEQIMDNALTLGSIKPMLAVSIDGQTQAIELVEHTELLIQERASGKNLLPLQICAHACHTFDKLLGTLVAVDDAIPVPWGDRSVLLAWLTLCPGEALLAVLIDCGVAA